MTMNSKTDYLKFRVLKTEHSGYSDCLDTVERELLMALQPPVASDISGQVENFERIRLLSDALSTVRALCDWADGREDLLQ